MSARAEYLGMAREAVGSVISTTTAALKGWKIVTQLLEYIEAGADENGQQLSADEIARMRAEADATIAALQERHARAIAALEVLT